MDIQDKVEYISRALDNQAFSQELQAILDLDKQIFVLVRAYVGKVRIIISETPELNYSFFHRDQDFIVSLDDDLSLKEVYAEMNDHLMTEEKLLKLARAVALIKSKLENQSKDKKLSDKDESSIFRLDKIQETLNDPEFQKSLDDLIEQSKFDLTLDRSDQNKYTLKIPIITGLNRETRLMTVASFEFLAMTKNLATLVINLEDRSSVELIFIVAEIGKFIKSALNK